MNYKSILFRTLGGFETKMFVAAPLHLGCRTEGVIPGSMRTFQLQKDKGRLYYQETL